MGRERPTVLLELAFLTPAEGGRRVVPDAGSGRYMPHAVVVDGGRDGGEYLGVRFLGGPAAYVAGTPGRFECELMHHPEVDYSGLRPGVTVAVREGAKTVASGTVLTMYERLEPRSPT